METNSETQGLVGLVQAAAAAATATAVATTENDDFMCDRDAPQITVPPPVEPVPGSDIDTPIVAAVTVPAPTKDKSYSKYKPLNQDPSNSVIETDLSKLDQYLEQEKLSNRNESWNKLDRGMKIQKLHIYAETYAKENKLPAKEIRALKLFFTDCVNKNKLQKAKEVTYDKTAGTILNISSLAFNATTRNFTLRNLDNKRVSTLKSLTPKRTSQSAQASLT